MVTVPHAVNNLMRRNLIELGESGFRKPAEDIFKDLKPLLREHKGAAPWFRGVQRRFPSQRAAPFEDARIDFDLRTATPSDSGIKSQSRWLSAAYDCFVNKEGSNYQIQLGVVFRYDKCPALQRDDALDLSESAWLACKPLVDLRKVNPKSLNKRRSLVTSPAPPAATQEPPHILARLEDSASMSRLQQLSKAASVAT